MPVGPPPPIGMGVPDDNFFTGTPIPPPPPMFSPPTAPAAPVEPETPPPSPPTIPPEPVDEPTAEDTPDPDLSTETGTPVTPVGPDPDSGTPVPESVFPVPETADPSSEPEEPAIPSWPRVVSIDGDTYDDEEARLVDEELAKELYKASPKELQKAISQPPSMQYVYMDQLQATVSVPETKRMYEREMATRAVELAITAQDSGDLLASMERAMAVDQAEILTRVTADDYDEFDRVVIGSRELDVKLVGESHMVRILATKKAGKTTTILEIMRCSITGEKAFGCFDIKPLADDETILFIDPELSPRDFEIYVKKAFTGMRPDEVNRIKRYSTRNQNEADPSDPESRPAPAVFDLSSEATRDVLILMCNKYNVARIVFDSYVKLIPGSTNKDDDVKRMLNNWAAIQGGTKVRESFWVGHINNSGEVRSSGSMLLDGTFESLLAITVDPTDRRFFQASAGRMTDAMEPREIVLDPETNRPIIMYASAARPVVEETAKPLKAPKGAVAAENKVAEADAIQKLVLKILAAAGKVPTRDGDLRYGGYGKTELISEVIGQWRTVGSFIPPATTTSITSEIGNMTARGLLISEYPIKGTKVLWLGDPGETMYDELKDSL